MLAPRHPVTVPAAPAPRAAMPAQDVRALRRLVLAGAAVLSLSVCAFAGFGIYLGYRAVISDGEVEARNLAKVVAAHAEQGVKAIDRNLASVEAVLKDWPNPQGPGKAQVDWLLKGRLRLDPNVRRLQILDAQGMLTHEAGGRERSSSVSLAARPYFDWHRVHASPPLHVSAPLPSEGLGSFFIPVSRRLTGPEGEFAGVIVASLAPAFLEDFYTSVQTGAEGSISISLRDGTLLARGPRRDDLVGRSFASLPLFREYLRSASEGSFRLVAPADGVKRVFGYSAVPDTDLVVVVGFGEDELLAGWRSQTLATLACMAIFLAALIWLCAMFLRKAGALAAGEARYRRLLDTASEGVFKVDAGGRISLVNQETCRMLGYTEQDLLGADPLGFVHPEDRDLGADMTVLRRRHGSARFELRVCRRDGGVLTVIVSTRSIFDDEGRYLGALVMLTDITQRAIAERALGANLARLEALRAMDHAILEARSPATIAAIALRGLRTQIPFWGATVMKFDPAGGSTTLLAVQREQGSGLEAGTSMTLDAYGLRDYAALASGAEVVVPRMEAAPEVPRVLGMLAAQGMRSYARIPLLAEGELIGALNLGSDTDGAYTEEQISIARSFADQLAIALRQADLRMRLEKQAAQLEQRVAERTAELRNVNRDLESFAYSVSHDLRAPARHVGGFAAMLAEEEALSENARVLVARIAAGARRMGVLIDALLSLSRTSVMPLERTGFDFDALIGEVIEELAGQYDVRKVQWVLAPLGRGNGDPALLRVAITNLLGNALKYSSRQEAPRIEVGCEVGGEVGCEVGGEAGGEVSGEAGNPVVYFVRDNGAGFDMAYADKLFGVFSRLHGDAEFEGTGIGLATVRRVIERHGGRIWAQGVPGQGAVFRFTLQPQGEAPAPPGMPA